MTSQADIVERLQEGAAVLRVHSRNQKTWQGDNDFEESARRMDEAVTLIESERKALAEAREALNLCKQAIELTECPHPARGRPQDDTAPACFEAGLCGCVYGNALERARSVLQEQTP